MPPIISQETTVSFWYGAHIVDMVFESQAQCDIAFAAIRTAELEGVKHVTFNTINGIGSVSLDYIFARTTHPKKNTTP